MRYTLPAGTQVEIRRTGQKQFNRYTTKKTLRFERPHASAYRGTVLYFREADWLICVRSERVHDSGQRD